VTSAHAQSLQDLHQDPEWIEKQPMDQINFYFLGVSENSSLENAKKLSHQNAIDEAAKYLYSEFKSRQQQEPVSININKLTEYLIKSAKINNSHWRYDSGDSLYIYYTLLSLNKRFAQTDIKLFAVQERIEVPKALSTALESAEGPTQENFARINKDYRSILTASKDSLSVEQYDKFAAGQRLRKNGEYEKAVELLNEVVKNNPSYYLGWYNLALAYDDGLKDFEKANQAYKKATELEPHQPTRHPSLYNNYGYFLLKHKKYEDAVKYLKIAVELNPDHPYAKKNLKAAEAALE
jgi:Flp pilus assembly protein TadD